MTFPRFMAGLFSLLVLAAGPVRALDIQPYSQEALQGAQTAGKPVALHFHADWCSTCRVQERAFRDLKDDPQLKGISLLVVDYDNERALKRSLKVRSQSVIVVFQGDRETARLGGETRPDRIKTALLTAR